MKLCWLALILVAALSTSFVGGMGYAETQVTAPEPIVITVEKIRPVVQIKTVEVIKTRTVKVIKEVPRQLREFGSPDELKQWLESQVPSIIFATQPDWDCDDYAEQLQIRANLQGYRISLCPVYLGDVFNKRVQARNWNQPYHLGNLTMIGDDIYYINPQTGQVTWVIYRDMPTEMPISYFTFPTLPDDGEPNWGKGGNPNKKGKGHDKSKEEG